MSKTKKQRESEQKLEPVISEPDITKEDIKKIIEDEYRERMQALLDQKLKEAKEKAPEVTKTPEASAKEPTMKRGYKK